MIGFLKKILDTNEKQINQAKKVADEIVALRPKVMEMSHEDMRSRVAEMRKELTKLDEQVPDEARSSLKGVDRQAGMPDYELAIQKKLWEFMPELFAMIREIMRRDLGREHHYVQLIAAVILAQGQKLTELKTGEGKTQVFHMPLILYALVGRGAHMVTVNEYLARRDGEYAGHVASVLGLSVGVITPNRKSYKFITDDEVKEFKGEEIYSKEIADRGMPQLAGMKGTNLIDCEKKDAYVCDITYGINNEFGFDYLRDNMAWELEQLSQRELYFCIVDEADSILIDEARTPLIISAVPSDSDTDKYSKFATVVKQLVEDEDFTIDHKTRSVMMTEEGFEKVEKILGVENVWSDYSMVHHLENALKAKALFLRDDQYIVRDGEVLIVDSFTGRVMPGRRFSEGIHQAIEAKEGVEIKQESKTFATITFQNFFRLYKVLCGGSGTIMTEAEEFFKIYSLESVEIPTNKPIARDDKSDLIYRSQEAKYKAVVAEVKARHEAGQPVLIGTTSVERSELVSQLLDEENIPHEVLNAKYHEREAQIVAKAGQKGAVTVATNMAGRGTDIPLTDEVKELGGLAVIGTERHESRRIDNQLRGRAGRQGEPGYSRFFVALDDQIMKILGGDLLEKSVGRIMADDMPIEMGLVTRQIETAQKRVEWANFDARKRVVDYDDVMNKQREVYYSRRRSLLELSEHAFGKFGHATQLSTELVDLYKQKQETARAELEESVKRIVNDETQFIVRSQFNGDKQLDEERLDTMVKHILDLAPDVLIARAFDVPETKLTSKLKDDLRGEDVEQTMKYLQTGIDRLTEAKFAEFGIELPVVTRMLMFEAMDKQWMEHLETMTDIRSGISLQAYAQRNPLVEYKNIAFREFESLLNDIDSSFARRFFKVVKVNRAAAVPQTATNENDINDINTGTREMPAGNSLLDQMVKKTTAEAKRIQAQAAAASGAGGPIVKKDKPGRNDPCPCGSGKKYKKCHYPEYG